MTNLAHMPGQEEVTPGPRAKMGRILVNNGKIDLGDVKSILATQNERGLRFGEAALSLGLVNAGDVRAALAEQFAYTSLPEPSSRLNPALSAAFRPESPEVEALRSLRSELMLRYFNTAPHLTLAVVGADDAAGIAQTTANLAIVFSQLGLRTLLVDTNLRNPQLNTLFGIGNRHPGLSDLVAGRAKPQPIAVSPLHSLWLFHAGTQAPNPQELLASKNYRERMDQLTGQFDVTLISTPPLAHNRDAQLVAAHAGAALVIAREHSSRMKEIETMCAGLWGVGVRLLGVALRQ
jgi:protein-tyrosine kinase